MPLRLRAAHCVQSMDGDLLYLKYIDEKWHKYTLLISKTKGAYDKHFFLLPTGNCIQLFYTLRSCGKLLLVQQLLADGTVPQPAVIAPIHDCERPFFAVADKSLDTCIYYQNEQAVFGCKTYKWSSKSLGEFTPVFSTGGEAPYAALDSFGRQHTAVCPEKKSFISSAHWTKHFPKHHGFPFRRTAVASFPICALKKIKFILYGNRNAAFCTREAKTTARPSARLCACCRPALTRYCFPCTKTIRARARLATFLNGEIKFYNIAAPRMQPPVLQTTSPRKR